MFKNVGYLLLAFVVGVIFFIIMGGVILSPELGIGARAALAIPLFAAVLVSVFAGYTAKNNIFKKVDNADTAQPVSDRMDDTAKVKHLEESP